MWTVHVRVNLARKCIEAKKPLTPIWVGVCGYWGKSTQPSRTVQGNVHKTVEACLGSSDFHLVWVEMTATVPATTAGILSRKEVA